MLESQRDGNREAVHQGAVGRALLVHVDEDLTERAVLVLAGAQVDLVPSQRGLLRVAGTTMRQTTTLAHDLDDALCALLRVWQFGCDLKLVTDIECVGGSTREWLREFRAVTVERVGLDHLLPRDAVALSDIRNRGGSRQVDRLRNRARQERLSRRHHLDVCECADSAGAEAPALVGAIKHREVLVLKVRRTLNSHRAADVDVRLVDLLGTKAKRSQEIETRSVEVFAVDTEFLDDRVVAHRVAREGEARIKGRRQDRLDRCQHDLGEAEAA